MTEVELMKVVSLAKSKKKGTRKDLIDSARLITEHGIEGDAHAGDWHRQVSLLASESIEASRAAGLDVRPEAAQPRSGRPRPRDEAAHPCLVSGQAWSVSLYY